MPSIAAIEGIGPAHGRNLRKAGVRTTEALLKRASTRSGRKELATRSGISEHLLVEWVNRADLMRIRGIGPEYSDLLEAAGVDTVKELRSRRPRQLVGKISQTNGAKHLVRRMPTEAMVAGWVAEARKLEAFVTY